MCLTQDPPELEFYKLVPMRIGNTTRTVGHVLLYAPSPQAELGKAYGMGCDLPGLATCHGPHIGLERWIGPDLSALATRPLQQAWQRPFRKWAGNQEPRVSPVGEIMAVGGVMHQGRHIWVRQRPPARMGVVGGFLGILEYRLAGIYAPANAEFSTPVFAMPEDGKLWLNADAAWQPLQHGEHCDEGCAAYVMVALLDGHTGLTIPGFERHRCVFMNTTGTRLPLVWEGTPKPPGPTAAVQLRVSFRDATVFAVGAGV